jgi:hypothetical protein
VQRGVTGYKKKDEDEYGNGKDFYLHRADYTRTPIKVGISIVLDSSQLLQIIGGTI